ncbi:hypothetical protein [Legionella sp.]|uniref:hypothetical protein n=1 Tax=Legionella sp. TaxID=459 RepID=UPI003CB7B6B6
MEFLKKIVMLPGKIVGGIFSGVSSFISNHERAISVAFWASLGIGAAVGLTLYLLPAALTAVASFSIYGLSIAGIVGANQLFQVGFAAGLAFAATSALVYLSAAIVDGIMAIKNACYPPSTPLDKSLSKKITLNDETNNETDDETDDETFYSKNKLSSSPIEVAHHSSPISFQPVSRPIRPAANEISTNDDDDDEMNRKTPTMVH